MSFLRRASGEDYDIIQKLHAYLSPGTPLDRGDFTAQLSSIQNSQNHDVFVLVLEEGHVVGCVTLFCERKFRHDAKSVLHVEDLVVDEHCRSLGYGRTILEHVKQFALRQNCYKIILNCSDDHIQNFYSKNGFTRKNIQMALYLE